MRQSRFLVSTSPTTSAPSSKPFRWWVPVTFTPAGGDFNDTYPKAWLREDEEKKRLMGLPASDKAVVFNVQETGYYRVNYDKQNWKLIAEQLDRDHTAIHVINRWP